MTISWCSRFWVRNSHRARGWLVSALGCLGPQLRRLEQLKWLEPLGPGIMCKLLHSCVWHLSWITQRLNWVFRWEHSLVTWASPSMGLGCIGSVRRGTVWRTVIPRGQSRSQLRNSDSSTCARFSWLQGSHRGQPWFKEREIRCHFLMRE